MLAAVYARRSQDQPGVADEARSVSRQVEHARAYAARKSWTVEDQYVYTDDAISGAEFQRRPGFLRLMNALKPRPPFSVLVMMDEDRLGREQIETAWALKQLITAGVRVFSYLQDRERTLESPTDKLLLSVTAFAGELEREKARQRTADAMLRRARAGHATGAVGFGYRLRPVLDGMRRSHVERVIEPHEATVVRRIFTLAAEGWGVKRIAAVLNDEGAPAPMPRRSGRPRGWAPSSVREILDREAYRGILVWNRSRKRDTWGQQRQRPRDESEWLRVGAPELRIVDEALWRGAQERRDAKRALYLARNHGRPFGRPPSGIDSPYLMTGFGTCGLCGGSMSVLTRSHGHQRTAFWGCMVRKQRGRAVCPNTLEVPLEATDRAVLESVKHDVLRVEVVETAFFKAMALLQPPPSDAVDGRERELRSELVRLDTEVGHLAGAIAAGGELPALLRHRQ
jgi:DNA invertase Pin-like site-specific DNA recombinase